MISVIMYFDKFLKEVVLSLALFLRRFITPPKYQIKRVTLEYNSSGDPCDVDSAFWKNEERFWDTEFEENETNITWMYKNRMAVTPYPSCVSDVKYRVIYAHNGNTYKYVTRDPKHSWPPKKTPGFHPPIKEAWVVMYDEEHRNVTDKIKKFAGPNCDFHGETLELSDIFGEQCVSLKITPIIGQSIVIKSGESFSVKSFDRANNVALGQSLGIIS
jgi:hypothetical protein